MNIINFSAKLWFLNSLPLCGYCDCNAGLVHDKFRFHHWCECLQQFLHLHLRVAVHISPFECSKIPCKKKDKRWKFAFQFRGAN